MLHFAVLTSSDLGWELGKPLLPENQSDTAKCQPEPLLQAPPGRVGLNTETSQQPCQRRDLLLLMEKPTLGVTSLAQAHEAKKGQIQDPNLGSLAPGRTRGRDGKSVADRLLYSP